VTVRIVDGDSMLPNYLSGSWVLVDRADWKNYQSGDVVILHYPGDPENRHYVKRVVAGPQDRLAISNGQVMVNQSSLTEPYLPEGTITAPPIAELTLKDSEYFTLGDNRAISNDSRFFGPVERRFIVGKVLRVIYLPD